MKYWLLGMAIWHSVVLRQLPHLLKSIWTTISLLQSRSYNRKMVNICMKYSSE